MTGRRITALAVGGAITATLTLTAAPATASPPSSRDPRLSTSSKLVTSTAGSLGLRVPRSVTGPMTAPPHVDVVVRVRRSSARAGVVAAARALGVGGGKSIPALGVESFSVAAGDADALAARLRRQSGVVSVHVASPLHLFDAPNDPLYTTQAATYLDTVNASAGWDATHGSSSVVVAVVDTGVRTTHEDLVSKVLPGWNAQTLTTDVTDNVGHGTFVAGIAGAATNNGLGVAGVGWSTSILPVKISDTSSVSLADAAAGIVWAADHGATVINCSFGGSADATMQSAVMYAQGKGSLVVAAAGNSGGTTNEVTYPAAYAGVISVGATTAAGSAASFSEHGSWVTVAAPGVSVRSTFSTGDADYGSGDGTSFASPIVAGEAALLKAADPSATAADLRTAIVASATPLPGQGMGAGRANIGAAFSHLPPTSVPTFTAPAASATVSGPSVTVSVTSTAPQVQFAVEKAGAARRLIGAPVAVTAGSAATTWSTFGYDGAWTLDALDCSSTGDCASSGASVDVTVANAPPVVTAPASGLTVSGSYVVSATAPGGGVRWLVDGTSVAFDATAPYSAVIVASLADGSHSVVAELCDASGVVCEGPSSAPVSFSATSLHPSVKSAGPSPFSPNGDRRRDTATVTYRLDRTSTVRYTVVNAAGAAMFSSRRLGTLVPGLHSVLITGRTSGGTPWPDGTYSVQIYTSAVVNNATLRGAVSRSLRVDDHRPSLSSVAVPKTTFYPVKDGYRDYFSPSAVPSEAGSLSLLVTTAKGAAVRTITVAAVGGRPATLSWNGRTAAGALVPAGAYVWRLLVQDLAGNQRYTKAAVEYVSLKHLVLRSATVTVTGASAYTTGSVNGLSCAGTAASGSVYSGGLRLLNLCDSTSDGSEAAAALYSVRVPSAVSYKALVVRSTGSSTYHPSYVAAEVRNTVTGWDFWPASWIINNGSTSTISFGSGSAGGVVSSTSRVAVAILLPNVADVPPYDWDIKNISLTISYRVLA